MTHNNVSMHKKPDETQEINVSQNQSMRAYGYKRNWPKTYLVYFAYTVTLGSLRLLFYWYPHIQLYATHKICPLAEATKVLVVNDHQGKCQTYFVETVKILSTKNWRANSLFSPHDVREIDLLDKLQDEILRVNLENGTLAESTQFRVFWCKNDCYVWDSGKNEFSKLASMRKDTCCTHLNASLEGLSEAEQISRRIVHGNNVIHVPVKSLGTLIAQTALNPFSAFQFTAIVLWLLDEYYYYTFVLLFICVYNVLSSAMQTRKNQISLRNTMASTEIVRVMRNNGTFESISSVQLVPDDIIELPRQRGTIICDAVLLDGTCVVNEAGLTGESVPVVKSPLPRQEVLYNSKVHSYNTIFCGTTIIQSRNNGDLPVLAKIIKTGMQTHKGTLVTSILYPPPSDLKFKEDLKKMIKLLSVLGLFETIYIACVMSRQEIYRQEPGYIVLNALAAITLALPASLPVVLMVAVSYARTRLKDKKIYCNDTSAINTSGSLDCVCFDKTGTLTENGLSIMGIIPNTHRMLGYLEKNPTKLKGHPIFQGMLVCHSLVRINGELMGDVLDLGIFESTGWELIEPEERRGKMITTMKSPDSNEKIYAIKQYQFSSDLQRMSVIAQSSESNELKIYVKGSPEMILSLSKPESCPHDALEVLQKYTEQGYRVIAFGCSELNEDLEEKIENVPREEVEKGLEFLGLIVFENKLKSVTKRIIKELRDCDIRIVMITGDNVQTAVSVAKECGIISPGEFAVSVSVERSSSNPTQVAFKIDNSLDINPNLGRCKFVVTGDTWQYLSKYDTDTLTKICKRGAVFARMTSNQKQQLIIQLMQSGHNVAQTNYLILTQLILIVTLKVAMCGDGANDCEALKAAHVGIALTEAESSVASPLVSLTPDISCVTTLIREGRAALVTSFGNFELCVTNAMVESITTLTLFWIGSCPTNGQFLYIDLCLGLVIGLVFGNTKTYEGNLVKKPPDSRIFSLRPLLSMGCHTLVFTIFQLAVFLAVPYQPWYTPFVKTYRLDYASYENYSIVSISLFQYVIMAVSFSRGEPYRKPVYTNYSLMITLLIAILANIYLTVWPAQWTIDLFELKVPPEMKWRYLLVGLGFLNFVVSLWVDEMLLKRLYDKVMRKIDDIKRVRRRVDVESRKNNKLSHIGKGMSLDLDKPRNEMPTVRRSFGGCKTATYENRAFVNDV